MSHLISLERESSVLEEEDRSRVDFAVVHSFLSFDTSSQGLHTFIKILWIHHTGGRSIDSRDNKKKQQQRIIYICTHPTLLTTIWTPSCSSYCFPDLVLFTLVHDDLLSTTTEALSNNKVATNERRPITMVDFIFWIWPFLFGCSAGRVGKYTWPLVSSSRVPVVPVAMRCGGVLLRGLRNDYERHRQFY